MSLRCWQWRTNLERSTLGEIVNSWKIVWDSYYQGASKSAYASELWRLSSWPTRLMLLLSGAFSIYTFHFYIGHGQDDWRSLPLLLVAELALIAVLDYMRGKRFSASYGLQESSLGPAESDDHRANRYLIFKQKLAESGITRSHINDLFDVLEAKAELESHRNERLNKFLVYMSGFGTALAIAWIKGLSVQQSATAIAAVICIILIVGPILWMLPSRRERLKELKYFMRLFSKSTE